MRNFRNENIWIIGASSGIGEALARELSGQGATLCLTARREEELDKLNEELGGKHHVYALDASDELELSKAANNIVMKVGILHRVVFLAALYRPTEVSKMDMEFAKKLVEVNLLAPIYATNALLPIFEKQQKGQLVLCGSVAGYTGLPAGQPYSATKAGVINFAETLYAEAPEYLDVKLINPGFVKTRITDKNTFKMPMRIEPQEAAKHIAKGLRKKAFEIHFPKAFTYGVKLLASLPYWALLPITRKIKEQTDKEAQE